MASEAVPLLKGTVDLLIMQALAAQANHGYGVMRWIEEATDSTLQLEEGSLYPALYRLEDRGLVSSTWGVSENNRRAKFYRLTPRGRTRLEADAGEFVRFARAMLRALGQPLLRPS